MGPDVEPDVEPGGAMTKHALRGVLLGARRGLTDIEVEARARRLARQLLAAPEVRGATTVAAYVSIGAEPGTSRLIDSLRDAGVRVLLPVLLPDGDLDWAAYDGPEALAVGRFGLREPTGPRLGVEGIGQADTVLVPGLAASPTGMRLGRGGGSYDRALPRVSPDALTCVLLYDDETGLVVPVQAHDRAVGAVATPSGVVRFSH